MRIAWTSLTVALLICLCACGQGTTGQAGSTEQMTWQEQYDLGVRYLEEGNYEEAIIAFTAAIEIDPKQTPAYVGRGDAYVLSGETEDNLTAAQADYEKAIELDETNAEAYLGLADVYIRQGDYEKALEVLQQGLEKTGDQRFQERLDELDTQEESSSETVSEPVTAIGYIIPDDIEYEETWFAYQEQYEINEQTKVAVHSYGIRFESPVDAVFDGEIRSIQEAEETNALDLFDDATDLSEFFDGDKTILGPMYYRRMEMTGYFLLREELGEITGPKYHEDNQMYYYTYHPNGEYEFYIQSYTLLD